RLLVAGRALWFYVAKLLWPVDLVTTYPLWNIDSRSPAQWTFPAAALAAIAALWWARRRIGRAPLVAALAFAVTLAPTLGLTDFEFMRLSYVADHFQYFASAALIALTVAVVAQVLARVRAPRWSAPFIATTIGLVLATLTYAQAGVYRDPESLWRHTLAVYPDAVTAHYNLGTIAMNAGRLDEAVQHFTAALRVRPDYANAHNNLASVLLAKGQLEPAADHYREAIRLNPGKANSHYNLAVILRAQGRADQAREHFAEALRLRPDFAEAAAALRESNREPPSRSPHAPATAKRTSPP
ncbi:MAG TPA: tetratricopeptide repeat protein, partial [Candidatus Kryptonia bacterium]|nr:tetratricopeptide repeat protein [Candidatus Kryptonia bacterium]